MALGGGCTSSGYASMAYGYGNIADDDFSTATGTESHAFLKAERAHAAGSFAQEGDTQRREFHIFIETTNSTPTQMDIAADVLALGNYTTWAFEILIAARRTDANDESAGYKLEGVIDRQNGAASTALVGSVTKTVLAEDTGAWDVTAQADTTGGALQVLVTGENAKTIRWTGVVRVAHVSN